jgi:hypothetical protein
LKVTFIGNVHDEPQVPRAIPEWWTAAWEHLKGVRVSPLDEIRPVCPLEFKGEVHSDVCAFDRPGFQTHTDSTTGETIILGEGNGRLGGALGVIWNDHYATMTRWSDKGTAPELIVLRNFAQVVPLCPEGSTLTFQIHSKWLIAEWDKMVQWLEHGYEGLKRSDALDQWHQIMTHAESGGKRVQFHE